jgi:Ca2+-binding EF-hand superfamily protein
MSRIPLILAGAALVALGGVAIAQDAAPRGPGRADAPVTRAQVIEQVTQRFQRLDANGDGRVTPEEMRQARAQMRERMQERMFDRMDLNHDGSITREEMAQAHAQMRERAGARRGQGRRANGRPASLRHASSRRLRPAHVRRAGLHHA